MKTFIKPSGAEVQVNEESAPYAEALGWVEKKAKKATKKPAKKAK